MKILILCDRESLTYENIDLSSHIHKTLEKSGAKVQIIKLNGDEIKPCLGCFGCWIKSPGQCIMKSDIANKLAMMEIQSDVLVLISKISYGGYSYDIKSFLDRSIPNISPFFEIVEGEMRHKMRYDRFPIIISIGYGNCTKEEELTFSTLAKRNALNMRPPKHFVIIMKSVDKIDETLKSLKNALK